MGRRGVDEVHSDPRQRRSDASNFRFDDRQSGKNFKKTRFAERRFVTVDGN
jgi:hypothetical protein